MPGSSRVPVEQLHEFGNRKSTLPSFGGTEQLESNLATGMVGHLAPVGLASRSFAHDAPKWQAPQGLKPLAMPQSRVLAQRRQSGTDRAFKMRWSPTAIAALQPPG